MRSRHRGLELSLNAALTAKLGIAIAATCAKHVYDFDRIAARGETFAVGRDVDTAPRWLASAEILMSPTGRVEMSAYRALIGPYFLGAENRLEYRGHDVVNLRARFTLGVQLFIALAYASSR